MNQLSPELVSLVHHVQLNQSGWWESAMERLVLATIWEGDGTLRVATLQKDIARLQGVNLDVAQVERQISRLSSSGAIVTTSDGTLKVSEERLSQLEEALRVAEGQHQRVRERFARELTAAGVPLRLDDVWGDLEEKWLEPMIWSLGARTYDLIRGGFNEDWLTSTDLIGFLATVPEEHRPGVRLAITSFLDPKDQDVRQYLLRMMDAYFIIEASQLSSETVAQLAQVTGQVPSFYVMLDTNVLLSILGLHGEAKKEAAQLLVGLAKQLSGRVDIKLYMMPHTIEETRAAIETELGELEAMNLSLNVAEGALRANALSDVARAYVEAVVGARKRITARAFLQPYISDLGTILRSHGIELYNQRVDALLERRDVAEVVERQVDFERRTRPPRRPKSRAQLRHDVALYFAIKEKRPGVCESPADAVFWISTEDTRFTGFDLHMRGDEGVPVCVQPLALVQILQFWTGRTERLEQALVGGMQLSVVTPVFPAEAERATNRILTVLSRYENADDLGPDVVAKLLINEALRQRLTRAQTADEEEGLVRDELLADVRESRAQASEVAAERDAKALRLTESEAAREADARRLAALEDERQRQQADDARRIAALATERDFERSAREQRESEIAGLRSSVSSLEEFKRSSEDADRMRRTVALRRRFGGAVALATALDGGVLLSAFSITWFDRHPLVRLALLLGGQGLLLLFLYLLRRWGQRREALRGWWGLEFVRQLCVVLAGVAIIGLGTEVLGNWVNREIDRALNSPSAPTPPPPVSLPQPTKPR